MIEQIEKHLDQLISQGLVSTYPSLNRFEEAIRYTLFAPGKRIRPAITLHTVQMLEGSISTALSPACALEMLHTYSLIHDDLPCMDDEHYRRGKLALHRVYQEHEAVLAGDFLLTYAFEVLSTAPHLSSEQKIDLITTLAKASGGQGMIGGQIMDTSDQLHPTLDLHAKKTGALFEAAFIFGGIIAQATSHIDALSTLGSQFGFLFQVVDDILDQDHPDGLSAALIAAEATQEQCLQTLHTLPGDTAYFQSLIHQLMERAQTGAES